MKKKDLAEEVHGVLMRSMDPQLAIASLIFDWLMRNSYLIVSMPLRLLFFKRLGVRYLSENLIPFMIGIFGLLFISSLEKSALFPDWALDSVEGVSLALLSVGFYVWNYWEVQYCMVSDPPRVWHSKSLGVPRFFYEPEIHQQRWTQPVLIGLLGCLQYFVAGSGVMTLYIITASIGIWIEYTVVINKIYNLRVRELDMLITSGEISDSSLIELREQLKHINSLGDEVGTFPGSTNDNQLAFRQSLRQVGEVFGHFPSGRDADLVIADRTETKSLEEDV